LKAFHRRYYHPSNARFFTYGNLPLEDHLEFIEKSVLARFEPLSVHSGVISEPPFPMPMNIEENYPVAPGEGKDNRSMVQVAWRCGTLLDPYAVLTMRVLASLLVGSPAAPLYKALLDSRLGSQLAAGTGYHDENRDTVFAAGLQGVSREHTEEVQNLVLTTLQKLSGTGFPKERVEAVIQRLEFSNREIAGDHFPYPLLLLFRMIGAWNHDGDPFVPLLVAHSFSRLRADTQKTGFFEDLIRDQFLGNPHRVTLTLHPDTEMPQREEERLRFRLKQTESGLTAEQRERIHQQAELLKAEQEKIPDLSCLPTLALEDIRREESVPPVRTGHLEEVPVQWCSQFTNGITYLALRFDLSDIPQDLLPWAGFFAQALTQVGAAGRSYTEMAERIEASTGGVIAAAEVFENASNLDQVGWVLEVRTKTLDRNLRPTCAILKDVLLEADFSDLHRLETLVGQVATSLENSVPQAGHRYAAGRAARYLTPGANLREEWRGIEQIRRMKSLAAGSEGDRKALAKKLQAFASKLIRASGVRVAVTAGEDRFEEIRETLDELIRPMMARADKGAHEPLGGLNQAAFSPKSAREGWSASVAVSYVTRVFRTVSYAHPDSGALLVLAKLLRFGYLHREIREKGGAYGGMAVASPGSGLFSLMSYRDPHFERTYDAFDRAVAWAVDGGFTDENIREAVLGVFSDLDGVLSPEGRGLREWYYAYQGITPEARQHVRDSVLSVNRERLVEVARRYLRGREALWAETAISNSGVLDRARTSEQFGTLTIASI